MGLKRWLQEDHPDLLMALRLLRYELAAWWVTGCGRLSPQRRRSLAALRRQRGLKLNIASGPVKLDGWINVDSAPSADVRMDLRRPLPLSDDSVSLIFCEHFADHLQFPLVARRFLRECRRVLEPGGRARFVLHDAEGLVRAYLDRDVEYFRVAEELTPTLMEAVNKLFRFNGFHQFLYDFETFERLLREAGFSRVIRCRFRESEVPELARDFDHPSRPVMSMYVEAVK